MVAYLRSINLHQPTSKLLLKPPQWIKPPTNIKSTILNTLLHSAYILLYTNALQVHCFQALSSVSTYLQTSPYQHTSIAQHIHWQHNIAYLPSRRRLLHTSISQNTDCTYIPVIVPQPSLASGSSSSRFSLALYIPVSQQVRTHVFDMGLAAIFASVSSSRFHHQSYTSNSCPFRVHVFSLILA